ncbi:MAG TPA: hypothetical protein DET40_20500 [Lentisphaeria bacterium]|nr:MAG: hypothetical protein A2X45_16265 [Lentisphaerae bacterium GWF2_50_93]HCE45933.1 hypothetical protein [Lentisphaeria bacterium]
MFPNPKPSNLVTVPSCLDCNKGFQKDEDYFRGLFQFTGAAIERDEPEFWAKVKRGLDRSPLLQATIEKSLRMGNLANAEGVQVGSIITIEGNWERVVNLIAKCVRGLYWFEIGSPLAASVSIECPRYDTEYVDLPSIHSATQNGKRSWPGVFEYKYGLSQSNPTDSAWVFRFYDTHVYIAFSGNMRIGIGGLQKH